MISISNLWAVAIAVVGLVLTVINIIDKALGLRDRARKPDEVQNERIGALERWQETINQKLEEHDRFFAADKTRIEQLEINIRHSNKIIIKSLQAIIEHDLDGNSIDQLKESRHELSEYLLDK